MSGPRRWAPLAIGLLVLASGCPRDGRVLPERTRLVFVHQPLGAPGPFEALLDEFRRAHPDIELVTQLLPNASDVAHQYFLTTLEGGGGQVDVFVVDVIWVPEFARAGWVADLSLEFPPGQLAAELLPGPAQTAQIDGRTYAVPWYLDVGLLYYRTDLVPRAPRTYEELRRFAKAAMAAHPGLHGYVFQGRQYEGLVCNVYEAIWGHGGQSLWGERLALSTEPAREALAYLRKLIEEGVAPSLVTSAGEEEARRVFQAGGAVFMRSWPYAWEVGEKEGSAIRGKFAFAPLPTSTGEPGWGALGGWQLALNARLDGPKRRAAVELLRHLTSAGADKVMALRYGRNPPRRAFYEDPELAREAPFLAALRPILERARPRPVTPYYNLLSDALQSEFSAALSGIRSPEVALERAQKQADRLMGHSR